MTEIVKVCKIHGELTLDQIHRDKNKFRCAACRKESNKKTYYKHREKRISTSMRWKQQNRGDYNEWARQDRKKNPEKYRIYERNLREKRGRKNISDIEIARRRNISVIDYISMFEKQNNKCSICGLEESRKSRSGNVCRLTLDHCHKTNKNRDLLCYFCNLGIGNFKDSIDLLNAAIEYLKRHE